MPYILTVSLRPFENTKFLYVDESQKMNEVAGNDHHKQCIYWVLDDSLVDQGGKFIPIASSGNSGFKWEGAVPTNFEKPVLLEGKTILRIKDSHGTHDPESFWKYMLTVGAKKDLYQTVRGQHEPGIESGNSPMIHNKTQKPLKTARKKK
jgi:hypothetical protein